MSRFPIVRKDAEWMEILKNNSKDPVLAFNVLFRKHTERPGTGEYNNTFPTTGHYACRACDQPLYSAESKFQAGCGWPAFDKFYKGTVSTIEDTTMGMRRIEILCSKCGGHLGHVFHGEGFTKTNERHCVNSISVVYKPEDPKLPEDVVKP